MSKRVKTCRTIWTSAYKKGLVDVLINYSDARWRKHDGWTVEGWNKVTKEFQEKFPDAPLTMAHIKRQTRDLKIKYKLYKEIRKRDVAWTDDCWIIAGDAQWREWIQADPRVKKVKHKCFPLYDLLFSLYEAQEASSPKPPEELPSKHEIIQASFSVTCKKKRKSSEVGMTDAKASCMVFKGANCECKHESLVIQDEFSISRCAKILNSLEELTEDEMMAAYEIFLDAGNRELFMSVSPHLRISWIRRKIAKLS